MKLGTAIALAAIGYEHIKDKSGEPYFLHCQYVANLIHTPVQKVCAYLHDVIEDEIYTWEELRNKGLTLEEGEVLTYLTHKKGEKYESYIERVALHPDAVIIKRADLRHNSDITRLKGISKIDLDRISKYNKAFNYLKGL